MTDKSSQSDEVQKVIVTLLLLGKISQTQTRNRCADDCVIAVGSDAAANRVMNTITKWIERKLGLQVNATKTKVTRPSKLKYLGFGFVKMGDKW